MNNNLQQLERELSNIQNTPVEYHVNLAQEIPLDLLRNGEFSLMDIDTSTDHGKALYDAAQEFMSLSDQATNAASQVQSLSNQLRQLYSQLINLPFEDLEKALGRIEKQMSTISSFMQTASSDAGVRRLEETLSGLFGKQADSMINTTGKLWQIQNRLLEESMLKQQDLAVENAKTYYDS